MLAHLSRRSALILGAGPITAEFMAVKQRPKLSSSAAQFRLFFPLLEPEGIISGFQDALFDSCVDVGCWARDWLQLEHHPIKRFRLIG